MSEPMQNLNSDASAKKKRGLFLPIALVVVAFAIIAFVASRAGLDKALVKQKLDEVIGRIEQQGRAQGRDIKITYGELELVGSFASKHVLIHTPVLTVKPLERKPLGVGEAQPTDSLIVTTPVIAVYAESMDLSAMRIEVPEPINFAGEESPDKSLLKITSNSPLAIKMAMDMRNNVPYSSVEYTSPTGMDLTYLREQQAKGPEEKTPTLVPVYETLNIAMAAGSGFETSFASDGSQIGNANVHFNQLKLTPKSAPEGVVEIATITSKWSNALNEKKQNVIQNTATIGPITAPEKLIPFAPVALNMDVSYTGSTLKTPETVAAVTSDQSSIDIKTFTLSAKDSNLSVNGNFVADASDVLPVGKATLAVTNLPFVTGQLRNYAVINPSNEALIDHVLTLVSGKPVAEVKDLDVVIERARGASFKIGQTTFEELFATFLKAALQHKNVGATPTPAPSGTGSIKPGNSTFAPALPPADKPKSKPIDVPDVGTRG